MFLIDIILTFFTSISTDETSQEITDFKLIAVEYLKSWFIFDVVSIIPIDYFLGMTNYNQLIRLTKISKLTKLVRMTRLARLLKLVKNQKKLVTQLSEKLSLNAGWDRLILLTTFFFFFLHFSSCIFLVIAQLEDSRKLFFTPY